MSVIQTRLKPIEPSVLCKGSAQQSIVSALRQTKGSLASENITSDAFEYPGYRSRDYTLGQHSLERHEKIEKKRNYLRDYMRKECDRRGKLKGIHNEELMKNVMDCTAKYRQKVENANLFSLTSENDKSTSFIKQLRTFQSKSPRAKQSPFRPNASLESLESKLSRHSVESDDFNSAMNQTSGSSIFEGKLQEIVRAPQLQPERLNFNSKKSLSREQSNDLQNYLKSNFMFADTPEFDSLYIKGENVLQKEFKYASSLPSATRVLVRKAEVP